MKRDWDLIRRIMLDVEELPTPDSQLGSDEIQYSNEETVAYHMRLLLDAKLIKGGCREALGPNWCYATSLTWAGHEFIDQIRRNSVWNRIKASIQKEGIDLSIDAIRIAAHTIIDGLLR